MIRKRKLVSRQGYVHLRENHLLIAKLERLQSEVVALNQKVACLSADLELRQKIERDESDPWTGVSDRGETVGEYAQRTRDYSSASSGKWGVKIQKDSYVYFILCPAVNAVKIGYSTNLKSRISSLQTGNPERLKLLTWMPGGRKEESILHNFFADYSVGVGEWFNYVGDLRKYIAAVNIYESGTRSVDPRDWKKADQPRKPSAEFIASDQNLRSLESADRYLAYALPPAFDDCEPEKIELPTEMMKGAQPKANPKAKTKPRSQLKQGNSRALPPAKTEVKEPRILTQIDGVFK